ncbi:beta-galactosidase 11-like isoform X2 [Telopea speciosissima]|uniref:beta-galactosidase 11-like isoform X2 n=2 Tax=Telopea speciosissima TaxID=54955 RepID=UPI001CC72995|nr:beta-galactosidase 11-like isoform X2 [Telopea speciosissima]
MSKQSRGFILLILSLLAISAVSHAKKKTLKEVTYDGRSLIINGKRELIFSGSVHYPRLPPDMWSQVLNKSKHGGLNAISTYVFWNVHEPEEGKWNFEGNYDLVKFIKTIQENGMYAILRLGPFIQAEWNFGGFPYWMREVNNVTFRTHNPPYKYHMKRFTKTIIKKMKEAKLFAPQGGPIILSQIENEYNTIQIAFKESGTDYIQWAANMAVATKTGVPWVMCKQKDAPDPVINACNGRNCGDTFTGPNKPYKPSLWTENWTAQYRVFGDPPSQRSAEDLAYAVARWFSKNGTLVNYYMYYGGTNYGRTSSSFVTTRYYDEAPLDEYGMPKDPKWGHLRDLHSALRMCKTPLLDGVSSMEKLGQGLEAIIYQIPGTEQCAAFLSNSDVRVPATAIFRGKEYYLPAHSISILPDCNTVAYNTQTVIAQHNSRSFKVSEKANSNLRWEMSREPIPTIKDAVVKHLTPLELMNQTKDTSDYLWYTTSLQLRTYDLPRRTDIVPVIQIANLGHAMHTFVNGEYVGSGRGSHLEKSFTYRSAVNLRPGHNTISLLGMTVGFPDSGVYLERRMAGIRNVFIQGLNMGTIDLTQNGWGHTVGVNGEKLHLYTQGGSHKVQWTEAKGKGTALTWYKTYFDAPEGNSPVALNLTSMAKGMAWVNGKSIGRYWVSYLSPLGKPSQSEYHVPRSFLKPTNNLLVLFEEMGGNPEEVSILTVHRDTVCSYLTEIHLPQVKKWKGEASMDKRIPHASLKCPSHKVISKVDFASFGDPYGACGNFTIGTCGASHTQEIVEETCLGKTACSLPVEWKKLTKKDEEPCPGIVKTLAVQVRCGHKKKD